MTVTERLCSETGCSVAIVGSRTFPYDMFPEECLARLDDALVHAGYQISEVVSGGADGVDTAAEAWAGEAEVDLTVIEPDWDTHGRAAGMKRNSEIVREADCVVAVWNGSSNGTRDTIGKARYALGDFHVTVAGIGGASPSVSDIEPREL